MKEGNNGRWTEEYDKFICQCNDDVYVPITSFLGIPYDSYLELKRYLPEDITVSDFIFYIFHDRVTDTLDNYHNSWSYREKWGKWVEGIREYKKRWEMMKKRQQLFEFGV